MVLCNAIYFKGNWASQFDPKSTQPAPFFLTANKSVEVLMMHRQAQFKATKASSLSLIDLPYAGGDLSMVILLPQAVDGLPEVERQFSATQLRQWLTDLDRAREAKADFYLPKFKTDFRIALAKTLAEMGMPLAFSDRADFSGMDGKKDLHLDAVIHQAFVDVNEEGTEAAAATGVSIGLLSVQVTPEYRADHPFLFLIREKQTGSVLFLGRVVDPTK